MKNTSVGGSFRDPSGFVYLANGELRRQVNDSYASDYERLMRSGLYAELTKRLWLVPHEEIETASGAYRTLRPSRIPFVSYPYEWCFSQLKDAALLTLDIQILSLSFGLSLKDASAYNIQFVGYRPVFIDTLSFEAYEDGRPWVAYRQFCQHFLGPLLLMGQRDTRLRRLQGGYIDGPPLDLVSGLLPGRTWLRAGPLLHLHLHARAQRRHERDGARGEKTSVPSLSKARLLALLDSLRRAIEHCSMAQRETEWANYYDCTNYSAGAMDAKKVLVRQMVDELARDGDLVHDVGANTGEFSRLLANERRYVVAHDIDELAVERHYLHNRQQENVSVLPLLLDLTSPSPALGWALEERLSTFERVSRGTVVALALIHHLAISNNVPLSRIAALFARLANMLVIEFVPKDDSQVQRLLATREDVFPDYTQEGFERSFSSVFEVDRKHDIVGSRRTLYAMRRRDQSN